VEEEQDLAPRRAAQAGEEGCGGQLDILLRAEALAEIERRPGFGVALGERHAAAGFRPSRAFDPTIGHEQHGRLRADAISRNIV
jgi:hypothetical protein